MATLPVSLVHLPLASGFGLPGALRRLRQNPRDFWRLNMGCARLSKQVEVVREIVLRLALPVVPVVVRDAHAPTLSQLATHGDGALEARSVGEVQRLQHRRAATDWKTEANAVRLAIYGQLVQIGTAQGLGKAYAEAFFAKSEDAGPAVEAEAVAESVAPVV